MKRLVCLAFVMTMPVVALAQSNYSFDEEVNAELDKMYRQSPSQKAQAANQAPQVQVNVQASPTATATQTNTQGTSTQVSPAQNAGAVASAPVEQKAGAIAAPTSVQKQPTTVVEASPLTESKAEAYRKARQDQEVKTEQQIVEKLEESRLNDEKRRNDVLFGEKFQSMNTDQKVQNGQTQVQDQNASAQNKAGVTISNSPNAVVNQGQTASAPTNANETAVIQAPVKSEPVQVEQKAPVATTPVVVVKDKDRPHDKDVDVIVAPIHGEVNAPIIIVDDVPKKTVTVPYFSGFLGMGDYLDVQNVRGSYSLGAGYGQVMSNHLMWEGSFLYSQYDVEQRYGGGYFCGAGGCAYYPRITQMNQYQGTLLVKYTFFDGVVRPNLGGLAAYSYRTYRDVQLGYGNNEAQSHALDLGVAAGVDFVITPGWAIGLDWRYLFNIASRTSNAGLQKSFAESVYGGDTPIEELSYMVWGVVLKATF